ncbi:MAG: rod shape-determining protein MreC [Patescibacteria group bacterium]|nr:rod shape-determining protein MreC [Patescibacteria group bacterium]
MQKKISILLLAIVFGAILIFANSKGLLSGGKETTNTIVAPVGTFFSDTASSITGFFSGVFNIGNLQEENAQLLEELNKYKAENARLLEVQEENKSLRLDLGFAEKSGFEYIPARVVAYDPADVRGMLTISEGEDTGVLVGMAVVYEGFLVGRVHEVGKNYAKIMLVTDPLSALPVSIQGTDTNGIARGELGSGLVMEKIPQGDKVEAGDTVITSGLGGEIPRGIIIGKVDKVESKENSLFVTANVRPEARLDNILRVLVIKN